MIPQAKQLSLLDSVSIIIGVIIGAGIFETAPLVAQSCTSWSSVLGLWLIGGLLSLCGALIYAELASMYPENGGDMTYLRQAFGVRSPWGFLFAWSKFVIVHPGSIASMGFLFATYFQDILLHYKLFPLINKPSLALGIVSCVTIFNYFSTERAVIAQNILSGLKVLSVIAIISTTLVSPLIIPPEPLPLMERKTSLGLAMILILFTYGGWNQLSFVASEIKNSQRNILAALLLGILATTILYLAINLSFILVLGHTNFAISEAVAADMLASVFPDSARLLMSIIICISAVGVIQAMTYTGSRLNAALGEVYPGFQFLAEGKKGIPSMALLAQGIISMAIVALTSTFAGTVVYTSGVVWFFFLLTGVAHLKLRHDQPEIERPYSASPIWLISPIFCLSCACLLFAAVDYDLTGTLVSFLIVITGIPVKAITKRICNQQHDLHE